MNEISETLFDNFDEIKSLQLRLNTFENFFRPGNVNWTVYLNRSASMSRDRQILVSFIDSLALGTIFYGSLFIYNNISCFAIEDIYYYKGNNPKSSKCEKERK